MDIEIKNIGASAAGNLTLRVDTPFESDMPEQANRLNKVFSDEETISMLAPGRRILYAFGRAPDYYSAGHPERYTVTASYTDVPVQFRRRARDWWRRTEVRYTDPLTLDFRQWSQATAETDYDNKNWNIASRQERRTQKILEALTSIADGVNSESDVNCYPVLAMEVVQDGGIVADAVIEHPVEVKSTKEQAEE